MPDDIVIHALKQRWFALALTENYPHTPKISRELDHLETAIRDLKAGRPAKAINQS